MNFFRDVVSHLLKNAFEGHTQFSVADNTAVGDNPVRSISLNAVPVNENVIVSLAWEGGEKLFEKTLSEKEAAHQFDLISTDLAEVASLTKQGQYDAAKDLMKKLGQKYAENTGEIVETNLPPLHNTQASEDDHLLRQAKITMQNLWFSTTDELLDYQQKQKGAVKPGDQDHIPLWDKNKQDKAPTDKLAPASLSYEDLEDKKDKEHEDMQQHIDEKIKTELESALQQKAASVFGPDQVELVEVLRKNGRNWDEIKKILVKDFGFDKDSTNIFVDEQRQGTDPSGIEVEPVDEKEKPLTPPEDLVSPETHDKLLQDHEDKKKGEPPVEAPKEDNFTPKEIMDIPEDEEIQDESALSNEIARADNDEIHKVAAPTDLNPLQEPIEQEPTTPQQDTIPMGKKPLDHDAPQKGDRVFVASDMSDEKAGFEGVFVSSYKSQGRDQYIVETDEGDLLDVDAHRVSKISENDGAQVAEPSMEPLIETPKEEPIKVTPKMSDFQSSQDEALSIKAELDEMVKILKEADSHVVMPMMYGIDDDSILQYANGSIYGNKIKSGQMQDKDWEALLKDTARWMTQVGRNKVTQTFSADAEWLLDNEQINKLKTMFNVLPKESSLKKEAGTTWNDLRMPEPPPAGWRVQHKSGLTGTIVDGNDKFTEVKLDQPIKEDEQTFRNLDLSWVQFSRGDQPKGIYAIYAGDGFGAWRGAPNWTLVDSGGKPIYPKGYQPPKPMEHNKNPNPEPAIDTESAVKAASLDKKASTDYYPQGVISLNKLKRIPGIKLQKSPDGLVLTDGYNYLHADPMGDESNGYGFTRFGANDVDEIINAIEAATGIEIIDEHTMQDNAAAEHERPGHVCDKECMMYDWDQANTPAPAPVVKVPKTPVKKQKASDLNNGPSDEDVQAVAWEMFKQHWNALSSEQMDQVYKALGVTASVSKQAAPPVDPTKTQFKDVKITPKYVPKQEATPAAPELDAVLSKMDALQQNLATLASAREQIEAKMKEEMAKIDQSGERVQMEAELQQSIEKAAILINAVDSKIVQWKDKLFTLQTEEVQYVPKLTQKELLAKIYAKFDGAEKYVKDVLNGMLSLGKNVTEKTLYRWPNKKSSVNKEASILDDMNRINEELMAALKELSSPI